MEAETSAPHRIVIVTGGTGLVGHGIQEWLEERRRGCDGRGEDRYVFLSRKDGNLLSFEETRVIFERYRPTHVIHLAAKVGGLYANMNYKVMSHSSLENKRLLLTHMSWHYLRSSSSVIICSSTTM